MPHGMGAKDNNVYLSSLPSGKYSLRLEFQMERRQAPMVATTVTLEQGVFHWLYFMLALVALSAVPAVVLGYHFYFAKKRWENSEFSPFQSRS